MREHDELLSSVRDDITGYKVRASNLVAMNIHEFVSYAFLPKPLIYSGFWECHSRNAVATGESCHAWKHLSCKFYSLWL